MTKSLVTKNTVTTIKMMKKSIPYSDTGAKCCDSRRRCASVQMSTSRMCVTQPRDPTLKVVHDPTNPEPRAMQEYWVGPTV